MIAMGPTACIFAYPLDVIIPDKLIQHCTDHLGGVLQVLRCLLQGQFRDASS